MHKIIVWLCLSITSLGYGQYSVSGVVSDERTGEPVIGATIYLQKLEKGRITDLEGKFIFHNISSGEYDLVTSSLGYGTQTLKIKVPIEGELKIYLSPTAIEMEEVIVSTPFHQLQSDNVMKVERASIKELSKTGSMNFSESISKIAGVETITTGSGIGKPVIRGLSSNRVLVYTQGVRLENQQFGDEHGLGISSSGIESVEIIKGPASLLYGSDALGGVLYLNPERYASENSTKIDGSSSYFTNTRGIETNIGFKSSGDKLKFLLRGNYAGHSDYKTGNGERVTNSRFKEWDLKTGIGYRTNSYKADLRYNLNSGKTGIPEDISFQSTSKKINEPYQNVQNHILSLDNSFYFGNSSLDLKLGYLFNNRKEFEDHDGETDEAHEIHEGDPALEMHLKTINYDAKYHLPEISNFETILGLQGMHQYNKNLGEESLIPDATTTDVGLLGTTHYHLEKIDFQAGFRFDHRNIDSKPMGTISSDDYVPGLERHFNSYNGAFGVKIDLQDNYTARLNLATGFRAPNLAELTSRGSHHGTNRYEIGNPELNNEQNYQLDLALELRNRHFEFFTNGFYNHINDYIYLNPTGDLIDNDPVFKYIQNNANMFGGEAGVHLHPHPLDWLHVESSYELVIGKQENGDYLPLIPSQSVLNTIRLELADIQWIQESYTSISLKTVFDQNRIGNYETSTPGYSLLNAGVGGSFSFDSATLNLQVSGTNLLNRTYTTHLSRLKPDGIPNMGRNISISAKVSF